MIVNGRTGRADEWIGGDDPSFVNSVSLGALGVGRDSYRNWKAYVFLALSLICSVVFLICTVFLRRHQHKVESQIDENNITPSDFTLFVTNIPLSKTMDETKDFF